MKANAIVACLLLAGFASAAEIDSVRLDALIAAEEPGLVSIRRQIHANPELSNHEVETAKLVADQLRSIGLSPRVGVAKTGVVAVIEGTSREPCVLLRADMDALPIDEPNEVPYRSRNPGVKHACGHDLHTSILIGAARVLAQLRSELPGSIKLVFQPAEEGPPLGEEGGAELMIKEGTLENPPVAAAFALHVDPDYNAGTVTLRPGPDMANADTFEIVITGTRSHGAQPHLGVDPIPVAAQIVLELQTMITRTQDARTPVIISVGQIEGGTRPNVIAGSVRIAGTLRTIDLRQRDEIKARMEKIVRSNCEAFDATYTFNCVNVAPMVRNDVDLARKARAILQRYLGGQHVLENPPHMIAEDFAEFAARVPAVLYHLGVRSTARGFTHPLHSELFDADEAAIEVGVKAMCALAIETLRDPPAAPKR
ncbi:MAG: amidohydrolase [Acidobacteriota bacterium]